jgi:hypothetical protein
MDIIVPFGYADVEAGGLLDDTYFGLYDIQVEPILLAWHLPCLDIGAGYAFWAPSGRVPIRDRPCPGQRGRSWQGFWSHMFTLGRPGSSTPTRPGGVGAQPLRIPP